MKRDSKNRSMLRSFVGSAVVVVFVVALFTALRFMLPAPAVVQSGQDASPLPTPETPLPSPQASGTAASPNEWIAQKDAELQVMQQTAEAGRLTPEPTGARTIRRTLSPITPEPTVFGNASPATPAGDGFIVALPAPVSSIMFASENTWYRDTEGGSTRTYVHAGAMPDMYGVAGEQGAVLVRVLNLSLRNNQRVMDTLEAQRYLTPQQAGPIRILDAVGERLILRSAAGVIFYFDVPARQFVPSLDVTVTPEPDTPTPEGTPIP